jgi:menaquinol-cytochrome c reductase iron-sulfur subunit
LSTPYGVKIYASGLDISTLESELLKRSHLEDPMAEAGHGISRRSFVAGITTLLGGIISAVLGLPAIGYLLSPALKKSKSPADDWIQLGLVENIPVDEPTYFSFTRTKQTGWERTANSYGVYVVKESNGKLHTFSNVCTHLSCRVSWKEDLGEYVCPCHDGHFAKDGSIISGPQPRPLDEYEHKVEDGTLMVLIQES